MKGYNASTGLGYLQPGEVVSVTAPYDVASGAGCLVGTIFGVAVAGALQGQAAEIRRFGAYGMPKATGTGTGGSEGAAAYWDNGAKKVTAVSSGNTRVGAFLATCTDNASTCQVLLMP